MKGRNVDPKIRKEAVLRYRAGEQANAIGAELGVNPNNIYCWNRRMSFSLGKKKGNGAAHDTSTTKTALHEILRLTLNLLRRYE